MPLEGPMLEAPGRSLFGLSGVLTAGSSRCLHSHAESLRVRAPEGELRGQGRAAAFQSWEVQPVRREPWSGIGELSACRKEDGFGASSQDHLTLCNPPPPGEMCELLPEIPLLSGL